jgi:hypothetical protein
VLNVKSARIAFGWFEHVIVELALIELVETRSVTGGLIYEKVSDGVVVRGLAGYWCGGRGWGSL